MAIFPAQLRGLDRATVAQALDAWALNEHADVHECAVLAHELPDRRMTLRAVVHLREGRVGDEAQSEILRAHVRSMLTPFKYPRIIEYVAELPKTGTGKFRKNELRKRYAGRPD